MQETDGLIDKLLHFKQRAAARQKEAGEQVQALIEALTLLGVVPDEARPHCAGCQCG